MENSKLSQTADEALSIFVNSAMAIHELNSQGQITSINENYLSLSGYSYDELAGQPCDILYSPDFRKSGHFDELKEAWRTGLCINGIYPHQHKTGRVYWLEAAFNPILDNNGRSVGSIGISKDVTEKLKKTAKNDTLHQALMIVECSPDGRILKANDLYLNTLKYEESEILGRNHSLHFAVDRNQSDKNRQAWDYILDGNSYTQKIQWLNSEGDPVWVEATYSPVFDETGQLSRIILMAQNITWLVNQEFKDQQGLRRLAQVCDKNSNPMLIINRAGEALYINQRFSEMFGYTHEDIKNGRVGRMFGPGEREVMPKLQEALRYPKSCQLVEIVYDKKGRRFWVNCSATHILVDDEKEPGLSLTFIDITSLKMKEIMQNMALEAMSQDRPIIDFFASICREVEKMMPETAVCVMGLDDKKKLLPLAYSSLPTTCALVLTGAEPGKTSTASCQAISSGQEVLVEDIRAAQGISDHIKETFISAGLSSCWVVPIISASGKVLGSVSFYHRRTCIPDSFQKQLAQVIDRICAVALEREQAQKSIKKLVMYDELTGLPNRDYFQANAQRMLSVAKKHGHYLTFIMIALDRFKDLNATIGHNQTEEIFRQLAHRIQEHFLRPSDFMGRIADDVLGLILTETPAVKSSAAAVEINKIISKPLQIGDMTLTPSVTQGICIYPADGMDMKILMHKASLAMRQARALGYGQFVFSTSEQDEVAKENMALESALRKAIGGSELRMYYQPQISLRDGRLFGAEALIRWHSPIFGNVSPGRFIHITEHSGLINPLSAWVVEESCRQLGHWRKNGLEVPALSINVSSTNFKDPTFFANLSNCMDKNDLYPEDLILELNESVYIDSDCRTISGIDKAYESGLRLSVDDFGTGYSCLSYLHRLPISEIKLDQSFVADFGDSDVSRRISQAIHGIGRSLGLNLIAEGVETEEQQSVLKEQGWHAVQGFLYSPALPGDEFENWLADYGAGQKTATTPARMLTGSIHQSGDKINSRRYSNMGQALSPLHRM